MPHNHNEEHKAHEHPHAHTHGGHSHHHHHHELPKRLSKAFALAVLLNLAFVIIEAVYAVHANSSSLLADAGHNLGDVTGLAFAWFASWLATKPSTQRYSYGYKRTTILSALLNALLLLISCVFIVYDAIHILIYPEVVHENIVMIVAAIGILINGLSSMLFFGDHKDDLHIKAAFLHLLYDAIISAGVVVSAIVIRYTHWYRLDPLVGLVIVIFIVMSAWDMLRDSINMMLDAVPRNIHVEQVIAFLKSIDGVRDVHDVHIWGLSTTQTALTAHLVMPEKSLSDQDFKIINESLKKQFKIDHVTIQVERGQMDDPCGHVQCN